METIAIIVLMHVVVNVAIEKIHFIGTIAESMSSRENNRTMYGSRDNNSIMVTSRDNNRTMYGSRDNKGKLSRSCDHSEENRRNGWILLI